MPRGVEHDEFGHRLDVGILAEKLLGLLVLGRPAVAGGDRVDKHEIGVRQKRVGIVDQFIGGRRQRGIGIHAGPPRPEATEVEPHGRRPRPAVEAKHDRPRGIAPFERVGDIKHRRLRSAIVFEQWQHPSLGGVADSPAFRLDRVHRDHWLLGGVGHAGGLAGIACGGSLRIGLVALLHRLLSQPARRPATRRADEGGDGQWKNERPGHQ